MPEMRATEMLRSEEEKKEAQNTPVYGKWVDEQVTVFWGPLKQKRGRVGRKVTQMSATLLKGRKCAFLLQNLQVSCTHCFPRCIAIGSGPGLEL